VSASVAFLGRCGRRLRTEVAAGTPCSCRSTLFVLRKKPLKAETTLSVGHEDLAAKATVLHSGAGPRVFSEDLLPPGCLAQTWRAPTRIRPYHTYTVSKCFYGCKCLNSRTRKQQGGWHPHSSQQMSR